MQFSTHDLTFQSTARCSLRVMACTQVVICFFLSFKDVQQKHGVEELGVCHARQHSWNIRVLRKVSQPLCIRTMTSSHQQNLRRMEVSLPAWTGIIKGLFHTCALSLGCG